MVSFGAIRFDFGAIRFDFGAIRFRFGAIRFRFGAIKISLHGFMSRALAACSFPVGKNGGGV